MIPTPYRVIHHRHALGPTDARGNSTETWETAEPIRVHAISGPEGELADPARPGGRVDLVVHGPAALAGLVRVRDRLLINEQAHAVVKVLDWTQGPWRFPAAGVEIHLQQIEGAPTL